MTTKYVDNIHNKKPLLAKSALCFEFTRHVEMGWLEYQATISDQIKNDNNNFSFFCKKPFFSITSKYNFSPITDLKNIADD